MHTGSCAYSTGVRVTARRAHAHGHGTLFCGFCCDDSVCHIPSLISLESESVFRGSCVRWAPPGFRGPFYFVSFGWLFIHCFFFVCLLPSTFVSSPVLSHIFFSVLSYPILSPLSLLSYLIESHLAFSSPYFDGGRGLVQIVHGGEAHHPHRQTDTQYLIINPACMQVLRSIYFLNK